MRVLVTGGRDYGKTREERFSLRDTLDRLEGVEMLIEGGALGADRLSALWAQSATGVEHRPVPADWYDLNVEPCVVRTDKRGRKYNAAAGGIRNQKMVDMKPDLVVAFPGGRGTRDCVARAERAGIKVERVGWQ